MRIRSTLAVLVLALPLAGCGGGMFGGGFDPTDMFNFLDNKKPLPGERRAVFPEGVPGVDQGIPQDMVRGSPANIQQRQQSQQDLQQMGQPQPQPQVQQQELSPPQTEASVAPSEPVRVAPPPNQRPKAPAKRRSVTAPPPDEEAPPPAPRQAAPAQSQPAPAQSSFPPPPQSSPFPPPVPSGTFQR